MTEQLQLLSAEEARTLTSRIVDTLSSAWDDVVEAYRRRADRALGYESWDAYCSAEFASVRLRLPAEDRAIAVRSLRAEGLSTRAIAAATGVSRGTVANDLTAAGVQDWTPAAPVTGQDGKSYAPSRPAAPRPAPAPEPQPGLREPEPQPEPTNAELDAELDAAMDGTAVRFRRNFTAVMARADDVGEFDLDRAAEVMDHDSLNRYIAFWRRWCDDLEQRMRARSRAGLRVIGGDR